MRYYILFLFIFISFYSKSQENIYVSPVKIPIFLSGSFGELRSNHFHSGIDIKTQQRIGLPVYSVADGYIDRIVVSSTGFGKALYINHPNGTTSVYAHLENFRNDITTYVRNIQYEEESFQIDVKVPENKIMVKQDEMIARSGNTGSSGGPH